MRDCARWRAELRPSIVREYADAVVAGIIEAYGTK